MGVRKVSAKGVPFTDLKEKGAAVQGEVKGQTGLSGNCRAQVPVDGFGWGEVESGWAGSPRSRRLSLLWENLGRGWPHHRVPLL